MEKSVRKWGDVVLFIGEYHHNIDSKSRLIVPVKFRETLGKSFVMTRGLEGCLFVYPQKQWESIAEKLQALPLMKKDARKFARMFLSGATEVDVDKNGRFIIPSLLLEFAEIEKACAIIGVQNRLEIWELEKWKTFCKNSLDEYEEMAEELIDFEIHL